MSVILTVLFLSDGKRKAFFINIGDLVVVGALVSIIGRKFTSIYYAALPLIVIARGIWAVFLLWQVVTEEEEPLVETVGLDFLINALLVRIYAPACVLYIVNFKTYLLCVLPLALLATAILNFMMEELYTSTVQCPALFENQDFTSTMSRDTIMLICLSIGFYSHSSTLVSRFINAEKAQL